MSKDKKVFRMFKKIKEKIKMILGRRKKYNEDDKAFDRIMRKKELKVKILGIVVNVVIAFIAGKVINNYYSSIENTINNVGTINRADTINNNYGEKLTITQRLQNALNYYRNEQYELAFTEYIKCLEDDSNNAIANLNIGYLYSHGLGCSFDYNQACHYYEIAIRQGMKKEGIKNYLALNLTRPNNFESTIKALKCGYEEDDENTIRYLSYLENGTMYAKFEKNCRENAKLFIQKDIDNQTSNLENNLVVGSVEIKEIESRQVPNDTVFRTYTKYINEWTKIGTTTIRSLIEENGEYKEILRNVSKIGDIDYYIITNYKFMFSDNLFSETFYEYVNI